MHFAGTEYEYRTRLLGRLDSMGNQEDSYRCLCHRVQGRITIELALVPKLLHSADRLAAERARFALHRPSRRTQ